MCPVSSPSPHFSPQTSPSTVGSVAAPNNDGGDPIHLGLGTRGQGALVTPRIHRISTDIHTHSYNCFMCSTETLKARVQTFQTTKYILLHTRGLKCQNYIKKVKNYRSSMKLTFPLPRNNLLSELLGQTYRPEPLSHKSLSLMGLLTSSSVHSRSDSGQHLLTF